MAQILRQIDGTEEEGVRYFVERVATELPPDYYVWHSQIPPRLGRELDLVVLHPRYGVWVGEVKDWALKQVERIDAVDCDVLWGRILKTFRNPVRQAWDNRNRLKETLERSNALLRSDGRLSCPVHRFVYLHNVYHGELASSGLANYQQFPA